MAGRTGAEVEDQTWSMAGREAAEPEAEGCDFRCLHRTARGRIFHSPEFRRVLIDFGGTCLILRPGEFQRLHRHLGRIAACGLTRSRLIGGERIRLRDATGEKSLILDLAGLIELVELMESAGTPGNESTERPSLPYQSAFINDAIAGRAFHNPTERHP